MRRYHSASLGGVMHLGAPSYDKEDGVWVKPVKTLCGLDTPAWSKAYVRTSAWSKRRIGQVCIDCDRTAMWESVISLENDT
ncbi:MAG: hypothetical protein ACR2N2_03195 [Acidimicrobiia bacterium]